MTPNYLGRKMGQTMDRTEAAVTTPRPQLQILLVEDNRRLVRSLVRGLQEEGIGVTHAVDAASATAYLQTQVFDLMILDLGLPDRDGMEVLAELRRSTLGLPVLVLTARDDVTARVRALQEGADDYVLKPFAFDELIARIRALSRRAAGPRWAPLFAGDIVLHDGELNAHVAGQPVALSIREHAMLALFLRHINESISREQILNDVFGYGFDPGTNLVDVHVFHLRRKILKSHLIIEAVRGIGYRLIDTRAASRLDAGPAADEQSRSE